MKIAVDYEVTWICNTIVEATDHADAAQQVREMGNAEHYDNCTEELVKVFDTNELPDPAEYRGCDYEIGKGYERND